MAPLSTVWRCCQRCLEPPCTRCCVVTCSLHSCRADFPEDFLMERPWRPETSAAAGANVPPGSTVTVGRAITAPALAKCGAEAGERRPGRLCSPRAGCFSALRVQCVRCAGRQSGRRFSKVVQPKGSLKEQTHRAHRAGYPLASALSDNVPWTRSCRPRRSAPP